MEVLEGTFDHSIFSNEENGYSIARLNPLKGDKVTIVGILSGIDPGESITCKGRWKIHAAHGRQFEVSEYQVRPPHTEIGIQRYLESGAIKGIGKKYAKRIVERFGLQTLQIIDESPHRLLEIEGIGVKRIAKVKDCWHEKKQVRNVMVFLRSHGVGTALAQKIYRKYGDESIDKVKDDPYKVANELLGVGFKTVDGIAKSMGIASDAPQRVTSGIEYTLRKMSEEGHVGLPQDELVEKAKEILEIEEEPILQSIETLVAEMRIIKKEVGENNLPFIWLRPYYLAEVGIAKELTRLKNETSALRKVEKDKAIQWIETKLSLQFASHQKEAIATSVSEKIHIITGGPGTGKSTITKAILGITEKLTEHILLAAPTGRAAKRMSEITRKKAFTIHSLLEFDFANHGFKRNKNNPLSCDLIIIDEASMIDTFLMYHLLKAIPDRARLIFIGDIDQLPSVGAGNVLKDLIESNTLPTTKLTEIFRQGKFSRIVTNAHRINRGIFPDVTPKKTGDFHFIEAENPEQILELIVDLNVRRLVEHYNFDPIQDIQVLSPMKRGPIGTEAINLKLQEKLNSSTNELQAFGKSFKDGDKVMQIRNNYNKKVFNGDVGIITFIDRDEQFVEVEYYGRPVEYDFTELDEIILAYAVSIHKYQGSECKCIIMPIHTSHFKLLYRNLLYTGITRGKKQVVLVGAKKAIAIAVKNDEVKKRHTMLKSILKTSEEHNGIIPV
ncbi:MAG: ATP-dependent RecD-like DNA helicase [Simkaniaceae bacterium]|nr:ATP-dependent RecD-like DNA helicase [Simkaniaceae bacterium]